uniref:Uncharacterized protein n=1 Tax=Vespula pensylvanica TaxID=30213 RepID=A0A834N4P5_VESPE|nr:hypothetical protein H0235_016828 [Vespula pensylvanica]
MLIVQRIDSTSGRIKEESFVVILEQDAHRAKDQQRLHRTDCSRIRYEDVDLAYVQPIMDQPGSSSRGPTPPIYNADECFGAIVELLK